MIDWILRFAAQLHTPVVNLVPLCSGTSGVIFAALTKGPLYLISLRLIPMVILREIRILQIAGLLFSRWGDSDQLLENITKC